MSVKRRSRCLTSLVPAVFVQWRRVLSGRQKLYSIEIMRQFDKFSSKEFINGMVKLSEMIDEALLITDNKGLIMMANDVALESFGKHILGRTVVEVVDDLDLSRMFGETTLQSIEQEVRYQAFANYYPERAR